jgi:putative endonuclease
MNKQELWKYGEKTAKDYLTEKGYEILDENFKIMGGEIDLITKKDNSIIVIEVKTRTNENWMPLEETIDDKKIGFLEEAFEEWLFRKNYPETFWQIDFIGIIVRPNEVIEKIVHIENIGL